MACIRSRGTRLDKSSQARYLLGCKRRNSCQGKETSMLTQEQNELLTRVEGHAPMGRLMREHYWIPACVSSQLIADGAPIRVRLLGKDYVAFRASDGRVGFFDERCPHRGTSLVLARNESCGLRCIFHGWKI